MPRGLPSSNICWAPPRGGATYGNRRYELETRAGRHLLSPPERPQRACSSGQKPRFAERAPESTGRKMVQARARTAPGGRAHAGRSDVCRGGLGKGPSVRGDEVGGGQGAGASRPGLIGRAKEKNRPRLAERVRPRAARTRTRDDAGEFEVGRRRPRRSGPTGQVRLLVGPTGAHRRAVGEHGPCAGNEDCSIAGRTLPSGQPFAPPPGGGGPEA